MKMKKARNFDNIRFGKRPLIMRLMSIKQRIRCLGLRKKGICDQLRRAVVSISSNIAEGSAKPSDADFGRFLDTALGSAFEVETQLLISKNIGYIPESQYKDLIDRNISIQKQLSALIRTIRSEQ